MRKFMFLFLVTIVLALVLSACGGGGSESPAEEPASSSDESVAEGDAAAGAVLFQGTCSACHGPDGKGLPNLGKDFTRSEFVKGSTNAELLAFVKVGRPAGDPANDTGVDMPPKGGNPAISDEDILDIIAHVRTLQE